MREPAIRRFALAVAVVGFAAVSTAPAQPLARPTPKFRNGTQVPEWPVLGTTLAGTPLESRGTAVEGATDDLRDLLETRVAELRDDTGLTAVAVAATIDGNLAGAAVSGERRRDSGISVTVDDRWHMGSITKSMTATLLAVLEDDGLLSADDALTVLLPDIEMADGWSACTLDHLLTHTAGVAANFPNDFQDVWPEIPEELVAERRRFIAAMLADEPEAPCGERFLYSNVGYTIAGHIAETIAGKPYEALIQNRVFSPLALMSAGFGPPKGEYPDQEPVGHAVLTLGSTRVRVPIDPFEMRADNSSLIAPAGTVHMTIGDLARYGATHLDGEYGSAPVLLSQSSWQRLHAPFLDDYARGWVRQERDWAGGSPDLAQRQQYVLVRAADVVAGQQDDLGVRDQRRRDRGRRHRVRRAGAGADRNGAGVLHRRLDSAWGDAGQGPPLHRTADADRRPETSGGLQAFPWTDPSLTAGMTPVRLAHLLELREALEAAYAAGGRSAPAWSDAAPVAATTPIRAAHLMELRAAVLALE